MRGQRGQRGQRGGATDDRSSSDMHTEAWKDRKRGGWSSRILQRQRLTTPPLMSQCLINMSYSECYAVQ